MANLIKKLIAGISTAAMIASLAVPVAFAEKTSVLDEDYTSGNNGATWTIVYGATKASTEDGLKFTNTGTGQRYSGIVFDSEIKSSAVFEYDVKITTPSNRNNASTFWICTAGPISDQAGNNPNEIVSQLAINANSGSCSANGQTFTVSRTNYATGWLHVEQVVNYDAKEVTTSVTDGENSVYSGTSSYKLSTAKIGAFGVSVSREGTVTFKNLKISTIDSPSVEAEDVSTIEVGTTALVATVSNATSVNVELSDESNFTYAVDEVEDTYEVSVTANADAPKGSETDVTITAVNDITVKKVVKVAAKTVEDFVDDAIDELALSGASVELVSGTEYTVKNSFNLPTASNENISITWSLDPTNSSYIKLQDNELIKVTKNPEMDGNEFKLTAEVSYGDVTKTKEFTLKLAYQSYDIYYNESFDGFTVGDLVNLTSDMQSNTDYEASNGMRFTCGSRSTGGSNEVGAIIKTLSGSDNYLTLANSAYTGQNRRPVLTLTRKVNVTNNLVIDMDVRFAAADDDLLLLDNSSNTLTLNVPAEEYAGQWLHYSIIGGSAGSARILVKDADNNVITYYYGDSTLSGLSTMSLTDTNASSVDINNLYVADDTATIADEDIVKAGVANLDITDLTKKNDVYAADTDFTLPAAPEGTSVTWTVMQKAKEATEWEESSFVRIAGTSAVINPTKDTADYDVKLVATVTAGDASDTKDFMITLPNPMDEINGILNNKFNIVNTTDTDAKGNVITFDLSGEDMLKRDLALPTSVKKYPNTTISWTSSDEDHIKIDDKGTATIMTSDFDEHDVKLTAVVTYKKGDVTYSSDEQVFNVTMGFEEADAKSDDATLGKYRVRYDAAYTDNFDIPTATTSNITLPTKGKFGSSFTWNSSAPTIISATGKVTRASTTRTVDLTAAVISGSASESAAFKVTVQGNGNTGGGGGGGGGGTASSTGKTNKGTSSSTISTSTSTAASPAGNTSAADTVSRLQEEALASNDLFTDIPQAAWARDAINGLAKAGVVNGKSDTIFAPNDTVTRAEFAKMLMGTLGLSSAAYTTSSFNDVSTDAWYFDSVESAYNLGIITGVADGVFNPDALITRQDMAVMVARAAQIAGKDISEVSAGIDFADAASISDYAKPAVEKLVKGGIINGMSDTEFAPIANATRAQAAKILYSFL